MSLIRTTAILLAILAAIWGLPRPSADAAEPAPPAVAVSDTGARERAAKLDRQFAALKAAGSAEGAQPIVAEIWSLWMQSGDTAVDAMLNEAANALGAGALIRAGRLLDEVLKLKPDYAEAWNKRATLRFVERRFEESLADCVEVLNREPRHFGALAGMGLIALEQGNAKAALSAFRRAHTIHPFLAESQLIPHLEKQLQGRDL